MKKRVVELANLMIWLIKNKFILELDRDGNNGGFTFATWSSANCLALPFFALAPELLDEASLTLIQRHIRAYIMYGKWTSLLCLFRPTIHRLYLIFILDAPTFPHGLPVPVVDGKHYCPIGDPSLTPLDIIQGFPAWISGFYSHSPAAISDLLSPIDTRSNLHSDDDYVRELALEADSDVPPTIKDILENGPETCEPVTQVARSHVQLLFVGYPFYSECRRKVFLDNNTNWPNMRREVVVCGRGVGLSLYAAWELKQRLNESGKNLVQQDLVHIHVLKDFNHMVSHLYHDVSRHLVDDASVTLGSTPTICRNACQSCLNSPRFASLEYLLSCVSNASRSQFNQNILMISRVRTQVPYGDALKLGAMLSPTEMHSFQNVPMAVHPSPIQLRIVCCLGYCLPSHLLIQ